MGETDDTRDEELSEHVSAGRMISAPENNTLRQVAKWVDDGEGAAVLGGAQEGLADEETWADMLGGGGDSLSCEEEERTVSAKVLR